MDALKIASSGLAAFQQALNTTSHNIANANTEGYSRQRVDLVTRPPDLASGHYRGSGVDISSINRVSDEFANAQVRDVSSEHSRLDSFSNLAARIDNLVADERASLTPALQSFFNSLEQLNTDSSSSTNRVVVLSEAQVLSDRFKTQDHHLRTLNEEVNRMLETEVDTINSLSQNLASLNETINSTAAGNKDNVPSDLLDQRDGLLLELSEHVAINITHYGNGTVSVAAGNGISMVSGNDSFALSLVPDEFDSSRSEISWEGKTIGNQIHGGSIGGILDFRRELLDPTRSELGRLATVFASEFNAQHQRGIDLNGAQGKDLFSVSEPTIRAGGRNTGTGTITASIQSAGDLPASDYLVRYNSGSYEVTRLSDEAKFAAPSNGSINLDGMEIAFTGGANPGDLFLIRPTINGARDISVTTNNGNEIAAAAPVKTSSSVFNTGDASISAPLVTDGNATSLTDTVEIRFSNAADYELFDASGASLGTGTLGSTGVIDNGAWQVTISGTPANGDSFSIASNAGGTADNTNSFQLSELQFNKTVGGNSTFQEGYSQLVNKVGQSTRQTNINLAAQHTLLESATAKQMAVSGVNLDEEAINLTRYQQAYQAAAQVISTSNTMFDTILSVVRR